MKKKTRYGKLRRRARYNVDAVVNYRAVLSRRFSYVSIVNRPIYYPLYSVSRVNIIYIIKGATLASGWFYRDGALLMILAASLPVAFVCHPAGFDGRYGGCRKRRGAPGLMTGINRPAALVIFFFGPSAA